LADDTPIDEAQLIEERLKAERNRIIDAEARSLLFNTLWANESEQVFTEPSEYMQDIVTTLVLNLPPVVEGHSLDLDGLLPPKLRVTIGRDETISAYGIQSSHGSRLIVFDVGLYVLLQSYLRAAATYFLPSRDGGPRPSEFWPPAIQALSTLLEWVSSPAAVPRCPAFPASPHQARVAHVLALYAIRFGLCHELAHFILGHPETLASRRASRNDEDAATVRQMAENREVKADHLGLALQMASLPDESQTTNALAGSVYFAHAIRLTDARLMLASAFTRYPLGLKDIGPTHPPMMYRVLRLRNAAGAWYRDGAAAVDLLSEDLARLDQEMWDAASDQQSKIHRMATELLVESSKASAGVKGLTVADLGRFRDLFRTSPLGVMMMLKEQLSRNAVNETRPGQASYFVRELVDALPPNFREWLLDVTRGYE
jgi:hypothetical protein